MEEWEAKEMREKDGSEQERQIYFCIDMKCFFASVECAERGLDPFHTPLVVADEKRGRAALCLAVSPRMKELGVKNRCRLYEIDGKIAYRIAKPRMKKYIAYAADIYEIYLRYFAPQDIHVYSIDEAFLCVTDYLKCYRTEPRKLAETLLRTIAREKGIPATAGIGTNLYLAKVALDISAKREADGIAFLDEESYREKLWRHQPITDFWQVAAGTARRLARHGIYDMQGVAAAPESLLRRLFGVNAELLIDHAWGRESCTMADIHNYRGKSRSLHFSQVLFPDYSFEKAEVVVREMLRNGCQELLRQKMVTDKIGISVGYAKDALPSAEGSVHTTVTTNLYSAFLPSVEALYARLADRNFPIRRLTLCFYNLANESNECYDLFTDVAAAEREKRRERTVLEIRERFGKNSLLRGIDFLEGATARERNRLVGGHNGE